MVELTSRLERVPVIVTTSDIYIDALRPFAYLANKYWSEKQQFYVAGFTPPQFDLPPNFHFKSIGKFEDYPIDKWSDGIIDFVEDFNFELFILMLEDYWLLRDVDEIAVHHAIRYMHKYSNIIKFDLCADRLYAGGSKLDFDHFGHLDIVLSDRMSAYHMSLMTGVWRRSFLLQVLKPGWNPWDVEIAGTTALQGFEDFEVVGSRQWPVRHTLAFRSGDSSKLLLNELKMEDVATMKRLGMLKKWGM